MSSSKGPRQPITSLEDCFSKIIEGYRRKTQLRKDADRLHSIDRLSAGISKYRLNERVIKHYNQYNEIRTKKIKGEYENTQREFMDAAPEMTRVFRDNIVAAQLEQNTPVAVMCRLIDQCITAVAEYVGYWHSTENQQLVEALQGLDNAATRESVIEMAVKNLPIIKDVLLEDILKPEKQKFKKKIKDLEEIVQRIPDALTRKCVEYLRQGVSGTSFEGNLLLPDDISSEQSARYQQLIQENVLQLAMTLLIQKLTDWLKRMDERLESIYPRDLQDITTLETQTRVNEQVVDDFLRQSQDMTKRFEPEKLEQPLDDLKKRIDIMHSKFDIENEKVLAIQVVLLFLQLKDSINKLDLTLEEYGETVLDPEFPNRLQAGLSKFDEVLENHEQFIRYIVNIQAALKDEKITQEHLQETFDYSTQLSKPMMVSIDELTRHTMKQITAEMEERLQALENQQK